MVKLNESQFCKLTSWFALYVLFISFWQFLLDRNEVILPGTSLNDKITICCRVGPHRTHNCKRSWSCSAELVDWMLILYLIALDRNTLVLGVRNSSTFVLNILQEKHYVCGFTLRFIVLEYSKFFSVAELLVTVVEERFDGWKELRSTG